MNTELHDEPTGLEQEVEELATSNGHAPDSLLGRVKAIRDERIADEHLLLGVPTWGDDLVAKFTVLDEPERERAAKKLDRGEDNLDFQVAVLSGACQGVYVRNEDEQLVALEDEGDPIRFDTRLTTLLGVEAESVKEVLLYLVKDNRIALNAFALKVVGWMQDTSQEVEGALVGESLA